MNKDESLQNMKDQLKKAKNTIEELEAENYTLFKKVENAEEETKRKVFLRDK